MSTLLISRKGKAFRGLLVLGILMLGACVLLLSSGLAIPRYDDGDWEKLAKMSVPVFCAIVGIWLLVLFRAQGKTFISVYDDHVSGEALDPQSIASVKRFFVDRSQNYHLWRKGNKLTIRYQGVSFSIVLTEKAAREVYDCVHGGRKTQSSPQTEAKVIVACPGCSTKCRVPAGKGAITVTCPKCGGKFKANT